MGGVGSDLIQGYLISSYLTVNKPLGTRLFSSVRCSMCFRQRTTLSTVGQQSQLSCDSPCASRDDLCFMIFMICLKA